MSTAARRAEKLDNFNLASEVSRHAAVAARQLSYAELAEDEGDRRGADQWRYASSNHEDFFLAEVAEARERLAAEVQGELVSYLNLFGARDLVESGVSA